MLLKVIISAVVLILEEMGSNKALLENLTIKLNLNIKYDSKNSSGTFNDYIKAENNRARNISLKGRTLPTGAKPGNLTSQLKNVDFSTK